MSDPALQREFWAAFAAGDSARMRDHVAAGADVNLPIGNPGGETPLIRSVAAADAAMVRFLIELGADVNLAWKGPKSWTPLMFAHDNPEMLQELIAAGANLDARTTADWIRGSSGRLTQRPGGETALHLATAAGNAEAVRTLLRAGAAVEAMTEDGRAPMDYAVQLGAMTETAEALVQAGAALTPRRLEAMHSSAHNPESDLIALPLLGEPAMGRSRTGNYPLPGDQAVPPLRDDTTRAPAEFRCPQCHALIYSRKPKICGQCGALLPPELVITDIQAQALADERSWACGLANKFSPRTSSHLRAVPPHLSQAACDKTSAATFSREELLSRTSCSEEFKHRDRPDFWLYVVGYVLLFFVISFVPLKLNLLPPESLLVMTIIFVLLCVRAWCYASPICPQCKQNIRFCVAEYCHVCGVPLKNRRCEVCGVDNSWTRFFRPYSSGGNFRWIKFCPGCGVGLDAKVTRWGAGHGS